MDHASRFRQNMRSNSTKCVRRIIPLQHWYPVRSRASPADPPRYCVLAAALQRVENRSMTVEVSLVERIEALSRSEFRAAVNAERRATLAIGALVLHWGQFDSSPGSMIQWMREKHEALGLDRAPQRGVGARGRPRSPAGLAGYVRRPRRAA
jgi:hypothetical protein